MGRLPVDIWAVSNVEVYGRHIEGNYVQYMCVLTCFFRSSEQEGSCCVLTACLCEYTHNFIHCKQQAFTVTVRRVLTTIPHNNRAIIN